MGDAAFFAGVRRELDVIDVEHVPADQSLGIAGHQDLAEQRFDLDAQVGDELGNLGVAGLIVAADGNELNVACTDLAQWCGWR